VLWGSAMWREVVEHAAMNIVKYRSSAALENIKEVPFNTNRPFLCVTVVHDLFPLAFEKFTSLPYKGNHPAQAYRSRRQLDNHQNGQLTDSQANMGGEDKDRETSNPRNSPGLTHIGSTAFICYHPQKQPASAYHPFKPPLKPNPSPIVHTGP
jgi:hypothetical protein